MANFAIDPRRHVHAGFELEDPPHHTPLLHEVFVADSYNLANEDMAIVKLEPADEDHDFGSLSNQLRKFFSELHQVRVAEIQPCAVGDAYVRFTSPLDRERFLGPISPFGRYSLSMYKHDGLLNARSFDLNRQVLVMLVAFPEYLRNDAVIARAVSTFGIMVNWHDIENLARVVVKVYLKDGAKIPDLVKVNVVLPPKGRSWMVPVFVLNKNEVAEIPAQERIGLHSGSQAPATVRAHIGCPNMNIENQVNLEGSKQSGMCEEVPDRVLQPGMFEEVTEPVLDPAATNILGSSTSSAAGLLVPYENTNVVRTPFTDRSVNE